MDWRKELGNFYGSMFEAGDYEALEKFIETEVIEKLIADLPDYGAIPETNDYANGWNASRREYGRIKKELAAKWLGNQPNQLTSEHLDNCSGCALCEA